MCDEITYRLRSNIVSYCGTLYGAVGTEVKLIADCRNVMIVEDKEGNRFPVKSDELTTQTLPKETVPKEVISQPIIKQSRGKVIKPSPVNQTNLF